MNCIVRKYEEKDFEAVNHILKEAFGVEKDSFSGDSFCEIVCEKDNTVVGYLLLTKVFNPIQKKNYSLIDYVCVDSSCRGIGIGGKLLEYAEKVARENESMYVQLTCSRFRVSAHRLYEKCNYQKRDSDIYRKELL